MSTTTSASNSTSSVDLSHYSPYGYIPTQWICYMFIVLFAVSTLTHVGQAIRYRMWWLFPTAVLAGAGEIIGWGGRLWSSYQIRSDGFLIQITTTIISPTPLLAANFIILGRVIAILGPQYSRLAPGLYKRIFLTCDLIALTVQAVGGALASMANTHAGAEKGAKIMLGGIIFQMVAITAYVVLASEFFARFVTRKPLHTSTAKVAIDLENMESRSSVSHFNKTGGFESYAPISSGMVIGSEATMGVKLMLGGLCFSTLVLFIRSVYRTIELNDGWSGRIIQTQVYFNVLDGAMIVLAMYCLNFLHPGHLLRE